MLGQKEGVEGHFGAELDSTFASKTRRGRSRIPTSIFSPPPFPFRFFPSLSRHWVGLSGRMASLLRMDEVVRRVEWSVLPSSLPRLFLPSHLVSSSPLFPSFLSSHLPIQLAYPLLRLSSLLSPRSIELLSLSLLSLFPHPSPRSLHCPLHPSSTPNDLAEFP